MSDARRRSLAPAPAEAMERFYRELGRLLADAAVARAKMVAVEQRGTEDKRR